MSIAKIDQKALYTKSRCSMKVPHVGRI